MVSMLPKLILCLTLVAATIVFAEASCELPAAWTGQWYWNGAVFNITDSLLGPKGRCVQREGIKLVVQQERERRSCYICVVLFLRHRNIIEFKESRQCSAAPSLRRLCRTIGADAPLHTMVRRRPAPEPCPFRGRFTFDYRRSERVCAAPLSSAWSCADRRRLVLQHQACPDVAGAERLSETLTCLATWRNHDTHFMFGRLDSVKTKTDADRYRCFIYQRFDSGDGQRGYHVVQSGDATCRGLQSVHDGHKVINLHDEDPGDGRCQLPGWFAAHHDWHSLGGTHRYHVFHGNHSIRLTHERVSPSAGNQSTRLVCVQRLHSSDSDALLVLRNSHGCTSGYQCAALHKRDDYVVELKLGDVTHSPDTACQYFDESRHNFTTLLPSRSPGRPCPYLGRPRVVGVRRELAGRPERDAASSCPESSATRLVTGCGGASDTLQLRTHCRQLTLDTEYRCHGSWEENGTRFLVTSPVTESADARRVCFVSMATSQGLHVATLQRECFRDITMGREVVSVFNITVDVDCQAEASTTQAGSHGTQLAAGIVSCLLSCLLCLAS